MEELLKQLEEKPKSWKELVKKYCRRNRLDLSIASNFTPLKIRVLYDRLSKIYESNEEKVKSSWVENELKAYHWLLIVLSALTDSLIADFTPEHWATLKGIFRFKEDSVLEYEAVKLVNEKIKNRTWVSEEERILLDIIKQHSQKQFSQNPANNRWNQIARRVYEQSGRKFFRSGKQCRQRWLNHLDPSKKHGDWNIEEDKVIVDTILTQGKRWSEISRKLGGNRTEHMVKNRYKSILIKQMKYSSNPETKQKTLLTDFQRKCIGEIQQDRHLSSTTTNGKSFVSTTLTVKRQESNIPQIVTRVSIGTDQNAPRQSNFKNLHQQSQSQVVPPVQTLPPTQHNSIGSSSLPQLQMHQVFTPYYINYPSPLTPTYFCNSPTLQFYLSPSVSTFEINKDLFLKRNN